MKLLEDDRSLQMYIQLLRLQPVWKKAGSVGSWLHGQPPRGQEAKEQGFFAAYPLAVSHCPSLVTLRSIASCPPVLPENLISLLKDCLNALNVGYLRSLSDSVSSSEKWGFIRLFQWDAQSGDTEQCRCVCVTNPLTLKNRVFHSHRTRNRRKTDTLLGPWKSFLECCFLVQYAKDSPWNLVNMQIDLGWDLRSCILTRSQEEIRMLLVWGSRFKQCQETVKIRTFSL